MIRKLEDADIDQVMQIWLDGNREAHPFITEQYWLDNFPLVQSQLPQAEVYVWDAEGAVLGFIGLEGAYIAGIFVEQKHRSLGIGKKLLAYAKKDHLSLSLSVYQQNKRAVDFYRREGFVVSAEGVDDQTAMAEYTMTWSKEVS